MLEIYRQDEKVLLGGRILSIKAGNGVMKERLSIVTLQEEEWNPETKQMEYKTEKIECWDNLALAVRKFSVESYITILCKKNENEKYTGMVMKTNGIWTFEEKEGNPERNILIGLITKISDSKNPGQYTQLTMPVKTYKKTESGYETVTTWSDIRFWDNSISGGRNDAKNVRMLAPTKEKKHMAVLICSQNKGDNTRKNPLYNGIKFEMLS